MCFAKEKDRVIQARTSSVVHDSQLVGAGSHRLARGSRDWQVFEAMRARTGLGRGSCLLMALSVTVRALTKAHLFSSQAHGVLDHQEVRGKVDVET